MPQGCMQVSCHCLSLGLENARRWSLLEVHAPKTLFKAQFGDVSSGLWSFQDSCFSIRLNVDDIVYADDVNYITLFDLSFSNESIFE